MTSLENKQISLFPYPSVSSSLPPLFLPIILPLLPPSSSSLLPQLFPSLPPSPPLPWTSDRPSLAEDRTRSTCLPSGAPAAPGVGRGRGCCSCHGIAGRGLPSLPRDITRFCDRGRSLFPRSLFGKICSSILGIVGFLWWAWRADCAGLEAPFHMSLASQSACYCLHAFIPVIFAFQLIYITRRNTLKEYA